MLWRRLILSCFNLLLYSIVLGEACASYYLCMEL